MSSDQPSGDDSDRLSPEPALDFLSAEFDPQLALQTSPSRLRLPCPSAQPCDNLQLYLSVVRGTRRKYEGRKGREGGGGAEGEGRKGAEPSGASSNPKPVRRKQNTVLWFMHSPLQGPLALLQRCYGNRDRVRVWVRHCAGVRGVCEGLLLAFDRHFNLVLGDVYEEYSPFRTVANGGTEGREKRRRRRKAAEERGAESTGPQALVDSESRGQLTRHLKQLFIRGDNIVMVAPLEVKGQTTTQDNKGQSTKAH